VFATKPTNLDELRNRILDATASTPEYLQNSSAQFLWTFGILSNRWWSL